MPTPWNNPYIPGDPYSYDLKWLVNKVKEYGVFIEGAPATIEALIDEVINNLSLPTEYINAKYPGHGLTGIVGDGVTDDTEVFKSLITYCETKNMPLYLPADCTVLLSEDVVMTEMRNVILQGTIKGDASLSLTIRVNAYNSKPVTWDITRVEDMKLILKGVKNGLTRVQYADALTLEANGQTDYYSIAYSTFILGTIKDMVIYGDNNGSVGGWINSNVFLGGRITGGITFRAGKYPHNHNTFYGTMFEGNTYLDIQSGNNNSFYDTRGEGTITYSFSDVATANLVTTHYTAGQPMVRNPLGVQANVTDLNGSNMVRPAGEDRIDRFETTLSAEVGTYCIQDVYPLNGGIRVNNTAKPVMETGLIPIDKPVWIGLESDVATWRMAIFCYDENMNQITTEPTNTPLYGATMNWTANNNYGLGSAVGTFGIGAVRHKGTGNIPVDSGVAYIKVRITTSVGTTCDHLTGIVCMNKNRAPASFHYYEPRICSTATTAPSVGDWKQGDIVYRKNATSGTFIGWVCTAAGTPGTWKTFGAIS